MKYLLSLFIALFLASCEPDIIIVNNNCRKDCERTHKHTSIKAEEWKNDTKSN